MIRAFAIVAATVASINSSAMAQTGAEPSAAAKEGIVVTSVRILDTERALKACIERHCPPDEDIRASLAHAENQFITGDYHAARSTLLAARNRNKRFAKEYPVPVSNLYRANARVAAHLGFGSQERSSYFEIYDIVHAGLPADDPRILQAKLEIGDAFARSLDIDTAQETYRAVAKRAQELNLPNIKGLALLRIAALYGAAASSAPALYQSLATKACDKIINDTDPRLAPFADAARLLKAKFSAKEGDSSAVDKLIEQYRTSGKANRAMLINAPPVDLNDTDSPSLLNQAHRSSAGGPRLIKSLRDFDDQWVDIAFYVTPDGGVNDTDVVRTSPKLGDRWWIDRVIAAVNKRHYAPLNLDPNDPGILRVERFTLTSRITDAVSGSRISDRSGEAHIESLDLSTS